MHLFLFDIDGTLVHSNGAGREALKAALEAIYGTAGPVDSYRFAGKTDRLIIGDLLRAAGIPEKQVAERLGEVYAHMAETGATLFHNGRLRPCPGVPALLAALAERPAVLLGLLTGNAALTAPLKLAGAGLDPALFRVAAYGSEDADRNRLPGRAMQRASELVGRTFSGENTTVIGDTPADIRCARAVGARAVAVATGPYALETLAAHRPDVLLGNLADTEVVLRSLLP